MPDMDEIDGLSDREIARKTYHKVCEVEEQVESMRERVEANEDVTEPIRKIAGSAWEKMIFALGWGMLIFIAYILFYGLKVAKKLKLGI